MTASPRDHPLRRQLGAQDHAACVDGQQTLGDCIRLVNRIPYGDDARVVHQDVHRAELAFHCVEKLSKRLVIRHVDPRVAWTRLNDRYRPAITLARLILMSSSLDIEGNPTASSDAFLVDMNKVFEDVVGLGLHEVLEGTGLRVLLQHTDHLDYHRHVDIRPDIVVRDISGSVAAVADIKYKRPSTEKVSPGDVYQAVAYATRYGLDRVALIFAEPPPVPELRVGKITVRLLSVDLSATPLERQYAMAAIAQEWLPPKLLSAPEACAQVS